MATFVPKIPSNQQHIIDHKKVKTKWFHACSAGNDCSKL